MLVIDTSGSMGATGIAAATQAAKTYLASAPADVRVGLITFSDAPVVVVPPTPDRAAVVRALAGLRASGETTLYDALQLAVRQLGANGSRSLVLLSDGGDSKSKAPLPAVLAAIKASGARAEVVGFKTTDSQNSVLTSIATAGQGKLVAAAGAAALGQAFGNAAKALEGQVRLSVAVPPGVDGDQPLVVTGLLNGQPLVASTQVLVHGRATATTTTTSVTPQDIVPRTAPAPHWPAGQPEVRLGGRSSGVPRSPDRLAVPVLPRLRLREPPSAGGHRGLRQRCLCPTTGRGHGKPRCGQRPDAPAQRPPDQGPRRGGSLGTPARARGPSLAGERVVRPSHVGGRGVRGDRLAAGARLLRSGDSSGWSWAWASASSSPRSSCGSPPGEGPASSSGSCRTCSRWLPAA